MGFMRRGFTIAGLGALLCAAGVIAGCGSSGSDGSGSSESSGFD